MDPRGRLLDNRYQLLVLLASGGMGRVWRARDILLERPVAVKVLRSEFTGDRTFRARFRAEAQHAANLHHPNIASVFDYGELEADGEQSAYLVMELVEGESLSDQLERVGRLSPARTLDVLRQTSAALAVAHAAGVVHRDVKPGNVLMGTDGIAKITDFGIAWSASSVPLTGTGQVVGTAHYLSPEQAQGGKATPASDVYALGAVAYECLAGRRAFEGDDPVQVAARQVREEPAPLLDDVPTGLRRLVERAMAKDPAARFPDGAALQAAVEEVSAASGTAPIRVTGMTGTAVMPLPPLPGPVPVARPPVRSGGAATKGGRRSLLPFLLGVLVALAAVGIAVMVLQHDSGTAAGGAAASTSAASSSASPSATPAPPPTVAVVADDLVGRPAEEVQAELTDRGLQVQLVPETTNDVAAGEVTAVSPEGALAPATTVTVSYAVAPADTGRDGNGNGNGHGHGNGNGSGRDDDD